jgi:hypothetical protein
MNERYKQLAEQAGLKVESFMTNPPKPFQILGSTEQFEKFAELIVRECMMLVEGFEITQEVALDEYVDYEASAVLKEHFGVEE